ncbi:monocarboxylate transporter 13-like [Ruditapes philippinarum]|uniref:monocarboxylate transporter 13-like n=1 Tax=Ruditapes philippinarum TaxID=129788 RepID=UPI00295BF77B|nr:monocarboxylate transporter 13-like [Ruditapes philippinarum]
MQHEYRDSAWSWLVLFCVLCCQILLGGICLLGGMYYIVFTNALGENPVEISWLCSLPASMWFLASPAGSVLTNRYGYRVCSFVGGVLAAGGLSISYFAVDSTFLFISYGFLTGIGLGINYNGCMSAINIYFDKYKTLAHGISSIGNNVGLILFSEFILVLEEHFGWRGMLLIQGGIMFNLCACAVVMFPVKMGSDRDKNQQQSHSVTNLSKPVKTRLMNFSILKKLSFACLCASHVFFNFSYGVFILHLPSYSRDIGFGKNDYGSLFLSHGICNIIGKVFYSFLGHHPEINVIFVYTISLFATGICMGLTPVLLTRTGILAIAGIVGFLSCVTGALINAVVIKIVGFRRFSDGIGMSLPFKATGNMIGGPVAGALFKSTGSYAFSFYMAGASMICSSCLMIYPIVHERTSRRTCKETDIKIISEKDLRFIVDDTMESTDVVEKQCESGHFLNSDK